MNNADITPQRPSTVRVDLSALAHNFRAIRSHAAPAKVLAIVKANAYGHGLVRCAVQLDQEGCDFFGVAYLEEGVELRKAGIKKPILVLGGIATDQIPHFLRYDLDMTASSIAKLQAINAAAQAAGKKARVHLKIDTGMEWFGVHHYSAGPFLEESLKCSSCEVVGIYSHFATSENEDQSVCRMQLERFLECTRFFEQRSVPVIRHIANTGAVVQFKEAHLDMVRPGVGLYGIWPSSRLSGRLGLRPVMTLASRVVYFKVVKQGAGVSYGHTWHASADTRVVTVPVGYGDGYLRAFSNRASVLVRGRRCPIRGRICMDQFMVDIGPEGEAYNGDEVVLIGEQGGERITVNELADLIQTTPHEILVSLNSRLPRVYS